MRSPFRWWLGAAALAAALRLWGIGWGLPDTFNADEPHLINLAVSFGGGSLRPAAFKYPTLWPYLLFLCYGVYFLFWSAFGLLRRPAEFASLFAWHPTGFYLIARVFSAVLSLAGLAFLWRAERRRRRPWAAALLAFSPVLVELAHSAKPDSLMFFFACAAWYFALKIQGEGGRRTHWACGLALGLAASSHFTALPAALVLPMAHFLAAKPGKRRWLLEGAGCGVLGFFAGSPYILLDFSRFWFWAGMRSPAELAALGAWSKTEVSRQVLVNMWEFAGPGSIAGAAAIVGLLRLVARDWRRALLLTTPCLAYIIILGSNPDGGWQRYLLGCFPALALLAAEGLDWLDRPGRPLAALLLAALAVVPGLVRCALADQQLLLPDTRQAAEAWCLAHIPQGESVLTDNPGESPRLAMLKDEVEELAERAEKSGSPRARLYRAMAAGHPGGGYRIYRILRTARDLGTYHPRQVELSQADAPVVDVRPGLDTVRALRIGWVVTSSFGASPERAPELAAFFDELYRQGRLEASFEPENDLRAGPVLRVFRVGKNTRAQRARR